MRKLEDSHTYCRAISLNLAGQEGTGAGNEGASGPPHSDARAEGVLNGFFLDQT